ncbi:MAG: hypothetical protein KDJ87_08005 [Rhizobiaceae bacterium]|nr:hypothetical protein [Rhizobiaceae bacterium]
MAAPAAIFILLPGLALAEVCDRGALNLADHVATLDQWLRSLPDGDQYRKFFTPEAWITGAILLWLIVGNGTRSTIAAIAWFLCLAIYHAFAYVSIDLADPYYQAAIREGCVEDSPRYILSNLGFATIAILLTLQRIRRRSST